MSRDWQWFGHAGHLALSDWCRFRMHTLVRGFVVSTVGELYEQDGQGDLQRLKSVGPREHDMYETFVFAWRGRFDECGCPVIHGFVDDERWKARYATAKEARAGHMAACEYAQDGWFPETEDE